MAKLESSKLRDEAIEKVTAFLIRRTDSGNDASPEERLIVSVIVQAISDSLGIDDAYFKNQESAIESKIDAHRFFLDGRLEKLCILVGLNPKVVFQIKKNLHLGKIQDIIKANKPRKESK